MDRKAQQLGTAWNGLPADLLANVLEHLPRDDPSIAAIRQTCRWAQHSFLRYPKSPSGTRRPVHARLWSAFSEPTGLTYLSGAGRWADEAVDVSFLRFALH